MKKYYEILTIEIYNCEDENTNKCIGNNNLEEKLYNHIKQRGFEDFVEIKNIRTNSEKQINCFVIIGNKVFKNFNNDELMNAIDVELDKALYSVLKNATRDLSNQKCAD